MISPAPTTYKNNIIVPIAVLPPLMPGKEPQLVCPAFIVPPGDWLIVWNLVTIHYAQLAHATFPAENGISLIFGQDQNFTSTLRVSETQWVASILNGPKEGKSKAFPLFYLVSFLYPTPGNPNGPTLYTSQNRNVIRHDPTIVVSQDPVEPT
ncbi:MAG TPA: hypothetical protein VN851_27065 [Thermoanaerobaculia bacterium]|nr:hypothetical protein [Thermoanaerobaculia bacterium]